MSTHTTRYQVTEKIRESEEHIFRNFKTSQDGKLLELLAPSLDLNPEKVLQQSMWSPAQSSVYLKSNEKTVL